MNESQKKLMIESVAQLVFDVFGTLCIFFSGYLVRDGPFILNAMLMTLGFLSISIRAEYNKDEEVGE